MYPQIGSVDLLVYRECPHGCWCATAEGERAPLCAEHELPMLPGGGPEGMFRAGDGSEHIEVCRERRLGFAALFGYEQGVLLTVHKVRKMLGHYTISSGGRTALGAFSGVRAERYYSVAEQTREEVVA